MLLHMADAKQRDGGAERRNRAGYEQTRKADAKQRDGAAERRNRAGMSRRERRTPKKTERTLDFL